MVEKSFKQDEKKEDIAYLSRDNIVIPTLLNHDGESWDYPKNTA